MTKQELIKRVKETSYLEGDFTLRSGKKSKYYLDKYLFETHPDILKALGEEFAKHAGGDVTLIAGAELGGVALAAATAMATNKKWIIVRNSKKDYGTSKMIEGVLKKDDVVLLVEDIATTGGQVLEAAKIITEAGAKVKKIVAVIDRKQGAGENITAAGYKFESIITKEDLGIKD
ncbi:MAG TPA: orotate phosphoribosyltransferase [Phycisphaerales bacterium]|nr:MAG: orotate phosphoribosyltransferase [Planctomycetes bacterium GWC2_45_44]HBG77470.1 orotate phosphoribosyltransferase [Phycisphaerales bacterium]HBR20938.1 orotate phosphoribosyltransferase [Phycisphaerales bacterium]